MTHELPIQLTLSGMKVLLFGSTGMVGQGVLQECLKDSRVEHVLAISRSSIGVAHAKLTEIIQPDVTQLAAIESQITGLDACFFCLGVSSFRMPEDKYTRITYDLTLAVAQVLARLNPQMTFVYVSGSGTDSSERSRIMWTRVKGRTENALLKLPFKAAYMFRPGAIQPPTGVKSKTWVYRVGYALTRPILPALVWAFPKFATTSQRIGRAMITVAASGADYPNRIVENRDINTIAAGASHAPAA